MPQEINFDHLALSYLDGIPWAQPLLELSYFDNSLAAYLTVVLVVLCVYLIAKLITFLLEQYVKHFADRTENKLDDLVLKIMHRSVTFILVLAAVYFGVKSLSLSDGIDNFVVKAVFILFTLKIARELDVFLAFVVESYLTPIAKKQKGFAKTFIPPMLRFTKLVVWTLAGLLIISNLGYNVTSLIAGLGIGGLALALAAQETLSNAFGSIAILTDQPFKVGDWVHLAEYEGEIVDVGMRSTKIKTIDLSIVSVPNTTVAAGIVENYSKRKARKVGQVFSLTYNTPVKKIKEFIKTVEGILKKDKDVETETLRVNFKNFGESALEFEALYYVTDMTSYARYLDIRERINLKIKESTEKIGVEMAFPTQSLYIRNAKDLSKAGKRTRARK
jgi:MscS family membrane protein